VVNDRNTQFCLEHGKEMQLRELKKTAREVVFSLSPPEWVAIDGVWRREVASESILRWEEQWENWKTKQGLFETT